MSKTNALIYLALWLIAIAVVIAAWLRLVPAAIAYVPMLSALGFFFYHYFRKRDQEQKRR